MHDIPLLELKNITKAYPGCLANDAIDLSIHQGQVHALLGENGAGKSTLVKIIYGVLSADSGSLSWEGNEIKIPNPAAARKLGIAMVFQHFSLFDSLTVVENIALGLDQKIDQSELEHQIREVSESYGLPLDPNQHVFTLSVGERQRIEIVRCLLQKPKLLVMDEPTSVLTPQEVDKLFLTLRRLSDEGMAILYISHKLDEVKKLCSKATILRQGCVVAEATPAKETAKSLAILMMGGEFESVESNALHMKQSEEKRLQVDSLNSDVLRNVSFEVSKGEIVGIAGVAGNGQIELLEALAGETLGESASVKINNCSCGDLSPIVRRQLGLCSVPEQRIGHGAVGDMTLAENSLLSTFQRPDMLRGGFIDKENRDQYTNQIIDEFSVRCGGAEAYARSLSGGNLQKFIVGREILQSPDLLIIAQPTWGVDAGAAATIHKALIELAEKGTGILIISQDLDEIMKICDRVGAICAGHLSEIYPRSGITEQDVGLLMGGAQLEMTKDANHEAS